MNVNEFNRRKRSKLKNIQRKLEKLGCEALFSKEGDLIFYYLSYRVEKYLDRLKRRGIIWGGCQDEEYGVYYFVSVKVPNIEVVEE